MAGDLVKMLSQPHIDQMIGILKNGSKPVVPDGFHQNLMVDRVNFM
jgi:hypothetical protein